MSGFVTVVLFFVGMAVFAWAFRSVARALGQWLSKTRCSSVH